MKNNKVEFIHTRTHSMNLKSSEEAVHSLDYSGTIIDVSPAWLEMTGYERDEVIGKHFLEFLVLASLLKVQKGFPYLKDFGFVDNVSLNIVRKDRVIIAVILNGTSKYTDEGVFQRTFCEMKPVNDDIH